MEIAETVPVDRGLDPAELDLPPPGLGRARTLATLALRECWDLLSMADKEKRSIISRRLKDARRQGRKVADSQKSPVAPHGLDLAAGSPKHPTTSGSPLIKPSATVVDIQRKGIRVVIVGHPEIVAYRYGDPNRDLIDANRILEGRRRELGID